MSRRVLDQTLSCIRELNRARTGTAVCAAVLKVAADYGFKHVLAGTIPGAGATKAEQEHHVLLHEWPQPWWDRYFSSGYLFVDPAIKRVLSGGAPFQWSELIPSCRNDPAATRVMDEAGEFRLRTGLTVPITMPGGSAAGFSLAGEHVELTPDGLRILPLLMTYALCRTLLNAETPSVGLSPRERDVLSWAAEGKSEWEIGMILGISEHTADKVLRAIRAKLGAVSTTHAIAKALRQGLID